MVEKGFDSWLFIIYSGVHNWLWFLFNDSDRSLLNGSTDFLITFHLADNFVDGLFFIGVFMFVISFWNEVDHLIEITDEGAYDRNSFCESHNQTANLFYSFEYKGVNLISLGVLLI